MKQSQQEGRPQSRKIGACGKWPHNADKWNELTTLREGRDERQKDCTNEDYRKEHRRRVIVAISSPEGTVEMIKEKK